MRFEIRSNYAAEAAHFLPHVPDDHKCKRTHGHSYRFEVWITGHLDVKLGWVFDYADLDAIVRPLMEQLDHRLLNDVPGLANPTAENIGAWLMNRVQVGLPRRDLEVTRVVVYETDRHGVTVWAV